MSRLDPYAVECPECGAGIGEACMAARPTIASKRAHPKRAAAARAARTERPRVVGRSVEIRCGGGGAEFHVERADGSVTIALTPVAALAQVRADDRATARTVAAIHATVVTWTNTPPGFTAPK